MTTYNDSSVVPFFEETRTGLTCDRRVGQEKFWATYTVDNCEGGVAPVDRSSVGGVTVTATMHADGTLIDTLVAERTLKCKR